MARSPGRSRGFSVVNPGSAIFAPRAVVGTPAPSPWGGGFVPPPPTPTPTPTPAPTPSSWAGYDVIVLAGQSNMDGKYGPIDATLDATNPRIMQYGYDANAVSLAQDPLDCRSDTSGTIGMGMTFAKDYLAGIASDRKVLLVPVAADGTAFKDGFWRAGGSGDTGAIQHVNAAMTASAGAGGVNKLAAILWHQGESDAGQPAATYQGDLDALIARWRSQMTGASASTPFVCGQPLAGSAYYDGNIVGVLAGTPGRVAYTGYANSSGLVSGGDGLHFDAASQRTLGHRYYTQYQAAVGNTTVSNPAPTFTTQPSVAGTARSGETLTGNDGVSANGSVTSRQWLRGGTAINGATNSTYTATSGDVGFTLAYRVTVTGSGGTATATSSSTAVVVAAASTSNAETSAARHWLFGTDNANSTDLVASDSMTKVTPSLAPTLSSGYLTLANGQLNGLRSTAKTKAAMTIIAVWKATSTSNGGFIGGDLSQTPEGLGLFVYGGSIYTSMATTGGGRATADTGHGVSGSAWQMSALSVNVGTSVLEYYRSSPVSVTSTPPRNDFSNGQNNLLGIGDGYFNDGIVTQGHAFAEFIIIESALTQAQLDAIYERSKTRLAARGVTLP